VPAIAVILDKLVLKTKAIVIIFKNLGNMSNLSILVLALRGVPVSVDLKGFMTLTIVLCLSVSKVD